MAKIIDGVAVAADIRRGLKTRVATLCDRGIVPGLAVIIVGDNPASRLYVRNKIRASASNPSASTSRSRPGPTRSWR
jgi:methylenetetrahydrofolate dehydrogenase (NADP+)/methenyltetrahydrofolate cyclohydrolase